MGHWHNAQSYNGFSLRTTEGNSKEYSLTLTG